MQLHVEKGMGASRMAGHGQAGREEGKVAVRGWVGLNGAAVTRSLTRLSWTAGEHDGSSRQDVATLVRFAGAKRSEWEALLEAEVTVGLRGAVTGVTCLAWLRPSASRSLRTPVVLVRAEQHGPRAPGAAASEVDEGGIYSW